MALEMPLQWGLTVLEFRTFNGLSTLKMLLQWDLIVLEFLPYSVSIILF